jgi:hypothetical protein
MPLPNLDADLLASYDEAWHRCEGGVVRGLFFAVLFGILGLAACGGGSSDSTVPFVSVSPTKGQSLSQGGSLNITATVFPDHGEGITWSLSGSGSLINQTVSSVTYTAPSNISDTTYAVVTATSVANLHASAYVPLTVMPLGIFPNVQPVNVDGGPVAGQIYPNGAFTSVTICAPGTLDCKTINGILVDTGSSGLRVLDFALPSLPSLTDNTGNTLDECVQFPDQSYVWGRVTVADVRIAGEVAGSISVQAIADPAGFTIPSDCAGNGAGINLDNQQALGANGILGVGLEPQDCGAACDPSAGGQPPAPAYYSCSSTSCKGAFVPLARQVTHPALFFAKDNNGVALQFAPLSGTAATLAGSITFGIGTQTNNALGNSTTFTLDPTDKFTTNVVSTGQVLTASSIDSGLSAMFFPDNSLATCPGPRAHLFCPTSPTAIAALNIGSNNEQSTINFSVDDAESLFSSSPTNAAFSALAGPNEAGSFEWGLPFFYGRTVFTSINGQPVPSPSPVAPWWAYTIGFSPQ